MKIRLQKTPSKYIMPLNVNSLRGHFIFKKSSKTRSKNILFIPDVRSNIMLSYNIINTLSNYGSVTTFELPGIGGMESFYKINLKPSIDNYVDYLSSLIKLRYKNKKIILAGHGFGFIVITKMLQKYDNISEQTSLVIGIDGTARYDDYIIDKRTRIYLKILSTLSVFSRVLISIGFKNTILEKGYSSTFKKSDFTKELIATDQKYFNKLIGKNDLATHMNILGEMSNFDNCTQNRLNLPLFNIILKDSLIDKKVNEQHLKIIYNRYYQSTPKLNYFDLYKFDDKLLSSLLNSKLKRLLNRRR